MEFATCQKKEQISRKRWNIVRIWLSLMVTIILALFFLSTLFKQGSSISNNDTSRIFDHLVNTRKGLGYNWLAELCDDYGHRKVGSIALENAIDYVVSTLNSEGLKVHTEPVPGLHNWVRGEDTATVLEPRHHSLGILAIGGSSPGIVQAEAVVLRNMEELDSKNVRGKIVVFAERWTGYGQTAKYRRTAIEVEKRGGVGVLVASVTPFSLYTPHAGGGARGSHIPSASVTTEEAFMLERWAKRGKRIVLRLDFKSMDINELVMSRNVIFNLPGTTFPNEIVLLSAHIDSWDVGQGAVDDGGGMAAVREAILGIRDLCRQDVFFCPKRTIRGVFWTAEEQLEYAGGRQYFEDHFNRTNEKFVFVMESDQGAFKPLNSHSNLRFSGSPRQEKMLQNIVDAINNENIPLKIVRSSDQGDVKYFAQQSVASVNYEPDKGSEYYFRFHHTNGDYVTIFDEGDIETTAAIMTTIAYNIGNSLQWDENE